MSEDKVKKMLVDSLVAMKMQEWKLKQQLKALNKALCIKK